MTLLAHISDLHFGTIEKRIAAGLHTCLEEIRPDTVIISGDLTQRATSREYKEAAAFIKSLSVPCIAVPGNHDIPITRLAERFFSPWEKWKEHLGYPLEPTVSLPQTIITGINSARRFNTSFDWSRGKISREQMESIQETFSAYDNSHLKVLVVHHPFWLPERFEKRRLIYGRDEALLSFEHGPHIILSGHVHVPYVRLLDGIIISHAGTGCSTRLVENFPNSFNTIEGDRRYLKIQQYRWQGSSFFKSTAFHFRNFAGTWHEAPGS